MDKFCADFKALEAAWENRLAADPFFRRGCRIALKLGGDWFKRYWDGEAEATAWIDREQIGVHKLLEFPEFQDEVTVRNF